MYIVLYTWHFQIYFIFLSPVTVCVCFIKFRSVTMCLISKFNC